MHNLHKTFLKTLQEKIVYINPKLYYAKTKPKNDNKTKHKSNNNTKPKSIDITYKKENYILNKLFDENINIKDNIYNLIDLFNENKLSLKKEE